MPIKLIVLIVFILMISGGAYWFSQVDLVEDHQKPELIFLKTPRGLGLEPTNIDLQIKDLASGIDRIVVTLKQRGFSKEIFRASLKGAKEYNFKQELIADRGYLVEGAAELEFRVLDRSLSGNLNVEVLPIQVDFKKPVVGIITSQHNLHLGGVQLAFYEVRESALEASGVRVGESFFYGFPARFLDSSLRSDTLFAVLYSVNPEEPAKPRLFARDLAGNYVEAGFYNLVLKRNFPVLRVSVNRESFLKNLQEQFPSLDINSDLAMQVEAAQSQVNKLIAGALQKAKPERMWRGTFKQPLGTVRTAFGAQLRFVEKSEELMKIDEFGYTYSGKQLDNNIVAANSGEVLLAEKVPFYGQIVVLNHGMGLNSLYGNLSKIAVQVGERVHAGQVIGERGAQGIFGAGTLFYEMRLGATPIEPREWWDEKWLSQHIDNKVKEVKVSLGL